MSRGLALTGAGLLALAFALLLIGVQRGEVAFSLFIIFPVLTITGPAGAAGAILIPAGLILLFLSLVSKEEARNDCREGERGYGAAEGGPDRRWGGVVLIGPIPILFGSSKRWRGSLSLGVVVAAATLLAVLLFILLR